LGRGGAVSLTGLDELELAGVEIRAISAGGIETFIDLPRLKVGFDVGRCPPEAVVRRTLLFTHAHIDHMGGVAYHAATRALQGMPPPTYVVPRANAEAFEGLFEAWRRLDRSDLEHVTIPLAPGEEHVLNERRVVRPFRAPHTVPAQGYAIWSRTSKLKAEYRGLTPGQIRHLRVDQGVAVTEVVETPEVAFTGDTLIDVVEREEVVRKARVLVMETTFLDDRVPVAECRSKGHVHLDEVIERAELFENEALLLTHFSRRYTTGEIRSILEKRLPAALRGRVTPLLAGLG